MATKHDFHKVIIGRAELLALVEYEAKDVPAKTDTGAFLRRFTPPIYKLIRQAVCCRASC